MWELGLIKPTGQGTFFHVMPMLQKSVDKCIKLIDHYMETVDAQKMIIPMLMPQSLLKTSGKLQTCHDKLTIRPFLINMFYLFRVQVELRVSGKNCTD